MPIMQVLLLHHLLLHHLLHLHLHRQDDECYEGAVLDVVRAVVRLEGGGISAQRMAADAERKFERGEAKQIRCVSVGKLDANTFAAPY
jgi:hypothetical protein